MGHINRGYETGVWGAEGLGHVYRKLSSTHFNFYRGYLKKIFESGELDEKVVVAKNAITTPRVPKGETTFDGITYCNHPLAIDPLLW